MRFETPKGTKDWAFKEAQKREKIIQTIVDVFKKWGYEPLYTPSLEMKKTLEAKAGEELNTQIFKIEKSDYGLRFDLTVGTARFVASSSIVQPYKRYSQGTVWRREEPQKGRLREFTQIDADIFGVEGEEAEAELLALSCEILERLGFRKFKIYLNNREIISDLIEKYNKKEKENEILRVLDKIDKISSQEIKNQLLQIGLNTKEVDELLNLDEKKAQEVSPTGLKRIKNIFRILKDFYQIESDKFEIDFCLARGLAYYTSTVFEIKLTDEIGSVSGGGRYDNLTDIYGKKVFAVGISFGLERLLYLLDKDKEQKIEDEEGVFLAWMEESCYKNALQLAKKLRQDGFIVSCNISSKKDLKEQIAYASKKEFKYLIIIGRKEVEKNCYTLKDLREKKQYEQLNYNELIEKLGKKNEKNKTRACC